VWRVVRVHIVSHSLAHTQYISVELVIIRGMQSSRLPFTPVGNSSSWTDRSCQLRSCHRNRPACSQQSSNKHTSSGNVWYNCLKSKSIHSSRPIYTLPHPHLHLHPRHLYSPRAIYGSIYPANILLKLSPQLGGRAGSRAVSEVED
jgi:hypothetical protein